MRGRLRSLFTPSDAGDAVAELIALRGRELEERSLQLRTAVGELERREGRARELHGKVEQILRDGGADLDVRQAELTARAAELDRREALVAQTEARIEERRSELGAVELRRAAVERREEAARALEVTLQARAAELDGLAQRLEERVGLDGGSVERVAVDDEHVAITSGDRYRILVLPGPVPDLGELVDTETGLHECVQLTASPFPNDRRRCAVLEPVPPPTAA